MSAILWHEKEDKPLDVGGSLIGSISSSLHRLKDMDSQGQSRDGGFFVFGDLSCKVEGKYRLKLVLYETFQGQAIGLSSCLSQPFEGMSQCLLYMGREVNQCQSSIPRTFRVCKSQPSCPAPLAIRAYGLGFARSPAS